MLDFELDSLEVKLRCYTNIKEIDEKFKQSGLKFVDERERCDICILDKTYNNTQIDLRGCLTINVDELNRDADAFISREYIEAYLSMLEKYETQDYHMADFNDIKEVTRGSLVEYLKISLKNDELEEITTIKNSLIPRVNKTGVIIFSSVKNLEQLSYLSTLLQRIYPHMEGAIVAPTQNVTQREDYIELFVFEE